MTIDRDLNAAINIARTGEEQLLETVLAGSAPATGGRGTQKTQTAKAAKAGANEASTPDRQPLDQPGSSPSQGEAA